MTSNSYKIVYIVGSVHVGSTLLDLLIGGHPDAFSLGEVRNLSDFAHMIRTDISIHKQGNTCACGATTIWKCNFWQTVNSEVSNSSGLTLKELDIRSEEPDTFAYHNKLLFDAAAKASGAKVLVDSTKIPERLHRLIECGLFDIIPIHLVRDPRGQVHSVLKRRKGNFLRPAIRNTITTFNTVRFLHGKEYIGLRYERLAKNPEGTLREVMQRIGLSFDPAQLEWATRVKHNLGGNRITLRNSNEIKISEDWRGELSTMQKTFIDIAGALARVLTRKY